MGEIASNNDVSRNAVHKHIKNTEAKLMFYEEKLGLYKKDKKLQEVIDKIKDEKIKKEIKNILD